MFLSNFPPHPLPPPPPIYRRPSSGRAMAGKGGMSWDWGVRLGAVVTTLGHPSNKGPDGAGVTVSPGDRKWLKTRLTDPKITSKCDKNPRGIDFD